MTNFLRGCRLLWLAATIGAPLAAIPPNPALAGEASLQRTDDAMGRGGVVALSPVEVKSSVLRRKQTRDALAPLRIETPSSPDYVLKLVNAQNGTEEMLIYVSRNSTFETKVPLGTYKIRGAFGPTWYGEKHVFGPDTTYFKFVQKDGKNDEFSFRRTGNQVNGYVVRLIKQVAGNLETPEIRADDF
jgi:hypothetical protein